MPKLPISRNVPAVLAAIVFVIGFIESVRHSTTALSWLAAGLALFAISALVIFND